MVAHYNKFKIARKMLNYSLGAEQLTTDGLYRLLSCDIVVRVMLTVATTSQWRQRFCPCLCTRCRSRDAPVLFLHLQFQCIPCHFLISHTYPKLRTIFCDTDLSRTRILAASFFRRPSRLTPLRPAQHALLQDAPPGEIPHLRL